MTGARMEVDLSYLSEETNRHGNTVLYVRRFGRRIRLRHKRGTQAFLKEYHDALRELGEAHAPVPTMARPLTLTWPVKTFGWLATRYFDGDEFKGLDVISQATRRGVIEGCLKEPFTDEDPDPMGNCPLQFLSVDKVKRLRDLKVAAGLKGAANNRKKYLSAMFSWAIEQTPALILSNPAKVIRKAKYATTGFRRWTREDVAQFIERHPIGTKGYVALCLLLFMGVRRGDVVKLGRPHMTTRRIRGSKLRFMVRKTEWRKPRMTEKPILPVLADALEAGPIGEVTFLASEWGRPFTAAGFGNWFADRCNEAGLPFCRAHGLRKAGATIAAENGATIHMLMAIFDWETPGQAKIYTDEADRKRLAAEAMPLLLARRSD